LITQLFVNWQPVWHYTQLHETFYYMRASMGCGSKALLIDTVFDVPLEDVMKKLSVIVIMVMAGALAGCNLIFAAATPTIVRTSAPTLAFSQPSATPPVILSPTVAVYIPQVVTASQAVFDRAALVITALKNKDMTALASYVHPQKGLRFSPYAAVLDTDQVIQADQVAGLFNNSTVYTWGAYAATGEPMQLTFADYYAKFIYDEDFANAPQSSLNHRLGVGTTLDNAAEYYPGAMIVEYYFPGFDAALEGMDWRSLRLVFMQSDNTWYLVGIIHDQWTT
jgi:hypothetical protein